MIFQSYVSLPEGMLTQVKMSHRQPQMITDLGNPWNSFLLGVGFGVFQWSHGCHPISLECTCSLRKAKAETPQETPAAAEASNCDMWSWLQLWFGLGKCQANVIELWHCESLSAILSRDFGLLYLVFSRGHRKRATRFRSRLKTLAVVSRRQLKPLPLPQRLLFHDSAIGEKPFVEATSTWVVHDELTFCQMDCGVLTEWSTVGRQRRRHQQLRHQWATKQRGECCWTCSINEIMYLASWRFSGQRILFFIR